MPPSAAFLDSSCRLDRAMQYGRQHPHHRNRAFFTIQGGLAFPQIEQIALRFPLAAWWALLS